MKKKIYWVIVILAIAISFLMGKWDFTAGEKEFVLINEMLYLDEDKCYTRNEMSLSPLKLDKKIGKTEDGGQIYSIVDEKKEDWICMYCSGELIVYRDTEQAPLLWIDDMRIDHVDVYDSVKLKKLLTVEDINTVEKIVSTMTDENMVEGEVKAESIKKMVLSSTRYPGLGYVCYFIIDKNEEAYIYDGNNGNLWKTKMNIFDE